MKHRSEKAGTPCGLCFCKQNHVDVFLSIVVYNYSDIVVA